MKKILIALLFLLGARVAFAQKDSLSFDGNNKYIYYRVVEQPGLTVDTFQNRMLYLLKTTFPESKISSKTRLGNIRGTGKFIVLSGISAVKHDDGEIQYTFYIQYREQRYRYWLTNFVFIPYKVDDFGNKQLQARLRVTLEHAAGKLHKKQFNRYLNETGGYCIRFGNEVGKYMAHLSRMHIRINRKKIIITNNW